VIFIYMLMCISLCTLCVVVSHSNILCSLLVPLLHVISSLYCFMLVSSSGVDMSCRSGVLTLWYCMKGNCWLRTYYREANTQTRFKILNAS